ncbi:MAG: ergothioneine biosynthesis protein EgtB [Burkholderiaceae bacterium]|nr:ergothioneine biosynthesis protein EgtB [Burkholderiaceae bacterium]
MNDLVSRFSAVRSHTAALAAPLSAEDCCVQSMPDASPVKWHLAHTTWFFETFVLEPNEPGFEPFHPAFRVLFNSYYNGVGARHPRPQRGLLTRPALSDVLAYRANVEQRMQAVLARQADNAALQSLVELGLQHEQQHQELLLTDVLHLLSCNPLAPAYRDALPPVAASAQAPDWLEFSGGLCEIGHGGSGFAFDNELPRHTTYLAPYALCSRLVSQAEFAAFVADGGYRRPELWLAEGWDWRAAQQIEHPLYWRHAPGGGWKVFGLYGEQPLDPQAPVTQLSYFEAEACARWAGARLPTEAEWEAAAASRGGTGTQTAEGSGLRDLFGSVWQWTQSSYAPYPGFRAAEGAVGEYNGKFMVNQYVLRGSSCATPPGHARLSYRNFFPATARWQFSGLRLARDL